MTPKGSHVYRSIYLWSRLTLKGSNVKIKLFQKFQNPWITKRILYTTILHAHTLIKEHHKTDTQIKSQYDPFGVGNLFYHVNIYKHMTPSGSEKTGNPKTVESILNINASFLIYSMPHRIMQQSMDQFSPHFAVKPLWGGIATDHIFTARLQPLVFISTT
jgi:hypothetical protein